MKIIIDTREKKPLEFSVPTERGSLAVGDYCAKFSDGSTSKVVFERKFINDLYGTLSSGYDRFKREISKSKEEGITLLIIVEGSLRRVLHGCNHSKRNGISIIYQLFTLRVRYGIETVFSNNREEMSQYITHLFLSLEREYEDGIRTDTQSR